MQQKYKIFQYETNISLIIFKIFQKKY